MFGEKAIILAHLKKLRESDLRKRWRLIAAAAISTLGMAAAIAVVPGQGQNLPPKETILTSLSSPKIAVLVDDERPYIRQDKVRSGESLGSALRRLGVLSTLAHQANRTDIRQALAGKLQPGTVLTVATSAEGGLHSASLTDSTTDRLFILEEHDGKLELRSENLNLDTRVQMQGGIVQSSLFAAMDNAGLPDAIAEKLAEIFGDDINFHSDLIKGDRFSVIYEVAYHQGRAIRTGRILAAEFINRGQKHTAYLHTHPDGREEYYNREGRSHAQGFLRSPLEFSRVSSGFSLRQHPVFGNWREHKGVDYAAPHGTAVKATSDGTVEFIGQRNGYGNFVILRHGDKYTTAYGHLSGYAGGLKTGDRVRQGQVIAYVGSTGWSTGPHLHYEFRIDGIHQNPLTVALPNNNPLSGIHLQRFRLEVAALERQLAHLESSRNAFLD